MKKIIVTEEQVKTILKKNIEEEKEIEIANKKNDKKVK